MEKTCHKNLLDAVRYIDLRLHQIGGNKKNGLLCVPESLVENFFIEQARIFMELAKVFDPKGHYELLGFKIAIIPKSCRSIHRITFVDDLDLCFETYVYEG